MRSQFFWYPREYNPGNSSWPASSVQGPLNWQESPKKPGPHSHRFSALHDPRNEQSPPLRLASHMLHLISASASSPVQNFMLSPISETSCVFVRWDFYEKRQRSDQECHDKLMQIKYTLHTSQILLHGSCGDSSMLRGEIVHLLMPLSEQ